MDTIDIEHLEKLSKLKIDESEKEKFKKDFEKIVGLVDEITKLDIKDEKQAAIDLSCLREDEPKQHFVDPLQNAPKKMDGCFVTPLVVE